MRKPLGFSNITIFELYSNWGESSKVKLLLISHQILTEVLNLEYFGVFGLKTFFLLVTLLEHVVI